MVYTYIYEAIVEMQTEQGSPDTGFIFYGCYNFFLHNGQCFWTFAFVEIFSELAIGFEKCTSNDQDKQD